MVELDRYGPGDLELTLALETDPRVMREFGGPRPLEEVERAHRNRIGASEQGGAWFAIVVSGEDAAPSDADDAGSGPGRRRVGEIGCWKSKRVDETIDEVGWTLLPAYQGRGIAKRALELLLTRLEEECPPMTIVATPGTGNAPSNGLCRSFGFELVGEDVETPFRDSVLVCNEWRLRLPR